MAVNMNTESPLEGVRIIMSLTLILLMWWIYWAPNIIPIYKFIQKDATLHSLFISGNCSTCFGWYFHPSSGKHTTVSTASGICHTVTAIWRYRGRVGTGLSVLWGHAVELLVEALRYKSQGRGFDSLLDSRQRKTGNSILKSICLFQVSEFTFPILQLCLSAFPRFYPRQ
jgi:hypothetical protein